MTEQAKDPFDNADYYSCEPDAELLEHEHHDDAIAELVDGNTHHGGALGSINFLGNITVYAWQKKSATDGDWTSFGRWAAENMAESFDDEYGSPHDGVLNRMGVNIETLAEELGEVFKRHVTDDGTMDPEGQCESVGKRTYTPAEVEAMMRKENPQWFEP